MFHVMWGDIVAEAARYWWLHLVRGIAAIVFALVAITYPGITLAILVGLVAAWAMIVGVFEIAQAFRLRAIKRHLTE